MLKIVIGGQVDKDKIASFVQKLGGEQVTVVVKSDIEAALAVKSGQQDYYIGACLTGGGGALAMAIALLGLNNCATLSMPGNIRSEAEIIKEVQAGKVIAFKMKRRKGFRKKHGHRTVYTQIKVTDIA